jgi:heat shock protein HtpX
MNRLKALILLATLTALVVWAGQLVGGTTGMALALAFAGVMNLGAWWWSDRLVLRMYGAHEVSEVAAPELYGIVRALAQRARIPMPWIYIIPEDAPNAFATGRSPQRAAVAVTRACCSRSTAPRSSACSRTSWRT